MVLTLWYYILFVNELLPTAEHNLVEELTSYMNKLTLAGSVSNLVATDKINIKQGLFCVSIDVLWERLLSTTHLDLDFFLWDII